MSQQDAFDRILASLYEAALDDTRWPTASRLIDEACGTKGNTLIVGQGPDDDVRVSYVGLYWRGERHEEIEREYLTTYHPLDERIARLRQLPDSRVVPVSDLYSARELKTSPTYNEYLPRSRGQNGLNVRLVLSPDAHLTLGIGEPVQGDAWGAGQIEMIERLLPHVRQFARVRRALVGAEALGASLTGLLDHTRAGVIHLDRYGRIVAANDHVRDMLRRGNGLRDEGGVLSAWLPADTARLERLLGRALPVRGRQAAAGGSMLIRRPSGLPGLTLHVSPVTVPQMAFGPPDVAALVLVVDAGNRPRVDAGNRPRVDAGRLAGTLGLTAAQSRVAALLARGRTVRDIAVASGRQESTIRSHVKQIHRKLGVSRRADLVRLVLSAGVLPDSRR